MNQLSSLNPLHITLRSGRDESVRRFHPWIFSGAIAHLEGTPEVGSLVEVYSHDGKPLGSGFYEGGSIAVRMLTYGKEKITDLSTFFHEQISAAYRLRTSLGLASTENTVYRLIHGEGDGLPGLIVDVYGSTAVVQAHSVSMYRQIKRIAEILIEVLSPKVTAVYDKSSSTLPAHGEEYVGDGFLVGNNKAEVVLENGIQFIPDWEHGQKTGFFIDQRENRQLVGEMSTGRRVLNMFCYSGGFSLYALQGNAEEVVSVDSSARALSLVEQNVACNRGDPIAGGRHEGVVSDAFEYLRGIANGSFDLIVLDPPAFAKKRATVKNALNGYRKLNALALERIASGGLLFTYSCSQAVSPEEFRLTVLTAAVQAGRSVRILRQMRQASDHPVSIYHPEGEYLKGLLLYVE